MEIIKMFTGHASKLVEDTYIFAAKDLDKLLRKLYHQQIKKSIFKNGKDFMNMELIYSLEP